MVSFFSLTHRNHEGLFVEPNIDASFRAADSVNFSQPGIQASNLINPNNLRNSPVMNFRPLFFFDYIFDKQNFDGSYSDIVGFGNMFSTYEAIKSIDLLNSTYLNYLISQGRTSNIVSYLINSLNDEGWGFKLQPSLNDSDIISTSNAIDLSKFLHATALLNNENITRFINSTWFQIVIALETRWQ